MITVRGSGITDGGRHSLNEDCVNGIFVIARGSVVLGASE